MRIGVDIGGTNFVVGLVDDNFKLVDKVDCPANAQRPDTELVADIIMLCKKIMEKHNLTDKDVKSIGIGIPGCHNPDTHSFDEGFLIEVDDINKKYESLNEKYIETVSNFEQMICNFKKEFDKCIEVKRIEELEEDGNQVVVHWMYGPMLLEETKDNCLVYKVLFPQYISKYASEEDRKNITKKYPLEATGFSLFAYGNPIKHFSYLYSDK